ncbi:MAG: hypothetical protein ABJ327_03360 [Litoreibacter sp.]
MRVIFGLLTICMLAACTDPTTVGRIRPGIGSDVDLDAIRPPSGKTYSFSVEQGGLPIPASLTLTSKRRSDKVYDYTGAMVLQVPGEGEQLREVAKAVSEVFKAKGPSIRGNQIFVPLNIRADNRFRSTSSSLLSANDSFDPHDCFAVLGTCRFTATRGENAMLDFVSETTESGGIWRTVTRVASPDVPEQIRRIREVMTYSIDEHAVIIDLALSERGTGSRDISVFKRQNLQTN